jgi:ATP-dependent Clp protease adaptor protein ClpS|tara:strand:+ start:560 stop:856 length:297 start_codon:yes stop_codon:yes gene_type:complete
MAQTKSQTRERTQLSYPKQWNVIFMNDDYTPMEFVIQLLIEVFNKDLEKSKQITMQIHQEGSSVAGTYNFEVAEQKVFEASTLARHNNHPLKINMEQV